MTGRLSGSTARSKRATVSDAPVRTDAGFDADIDAAHSGDAGPAAAHPAPGDAASEVPFVERRKNTRDRRRTTLLSVIRGALNPRRRGGRRASDRTQPIDWHDPCLLVLSVVTLVLSVADAFLTVMLLGDGAIETNPLFAYVLHGHPELFAPVKMALTGTSVILLVAVARCRLLGLVSARCVIQAFAIVYFVLLAYEVTLVWKFA